MVVMKMVTKDNVMSERVAITQQACSWQVVFILVSSSLRLSRVFPTADNRKWKHESLLGDKGGGEGLYILICGSDHY